MSVIKQKTFNLGNVKYYGSKIKSNKVLVDMELRDNGDDKVEFAVTGEIVSCHGNDWKCLGQCYDSIEEVSEQFTPENKKLWDIIQRLWKQYHLNSLHAGTYEQEKALEDAGINRDNYDECCDYLDSVNLLRVNHEGKKYKFGESWLYWAIPKNDMDLINSLMA